MVDVGPLLPGHPDDVPAPGTRYYSPGGIIQKPSAVIVGADQREAERITRELRAYWQREAGHPSSMASGRVIALPGNARLEVVSAPVADQDTAETISSDPDFAGAVARLAEQVQAATGVPPVLLGKRTADDGAYPWVIADDGRGFRLGADGRVLEIATTALSPAAAMVAHAERELRERAEQERVEADIADDLAAAQERTRRETHRAGRRRYDFDRNHYTPEPEPEPEPDPEAEKRAELRKLGHGLRLARTRERAAQEALSTAIRLPQRHTVGRALAMRTLLGAFPVGALLVALASVYGGPAAPLMAILWWSLVIVATTSAAAWHHAQLRSVPDRIDDQFRHTLAAESDLTEAELNYAAAGGDPDNDDLPRPPRLPRL